MAEGKQKIICNPAHLPIYVHCLNGANVTGLLMVCLRKLQLWSLPVSMAEFARQIRDGVLSTEEQEFMEKFNGLPNSGGQSSTLVSTTVTISDEFLEHINSTTTNSNNNNNNNNNSNNNNNNNNNQQQQQPATADGLYLTALTALPPWLWEGQLPETFVKSIQISNLPNETPQQFNSNYLYTVTYSHPYVRVILPPWCLRQLIMQRLSSSGATVGVSSSGRLSADNLFTFPQPQQSQPSPQLQPSILQQQQLQSVQYASAFALGSGKSRPSSAAINPILSSNSSSGPALMSDESLRVTSATGSLSSGIAGVGPILSGTTAVGNLLTMSSTLDVQDGGASVMHTNNTQHNNSGEGSGDGVGDDGVEENDSVGAGERQQQSYEEYEDEEVSMTVKALALEGL